MNEQNLPHNFDEVLALRGIQRLSFEPPIRERALYQKVMAKQPGYSRLWEPSRRHSGYWDRHFWTYWDWRSLRFCAPIFYHASELTGFSETGDLCRLLVTGSWTPTVGTSNQAGWRFLTDSTTMICGHQITEGYLEPDDRLPAAEATRKRGRKTCTCFCGCRKSPRRRHTCIRCGRKLGKVCCLAAGDEKTKDAVCHRCLPDDDPQPDLWDPVLWDMMC